MKSGCPKEYVDFAENLANIAGKILSKYYRAAGKTNQKSDRSLVTIADVAVEKVLRKEIRNKYPSHGIIGEELGRSGVNSKYQWTIDPIDGTSSFVIGRPLFGTMISLVYDKKPILGVIDQPILRERWVGANDKTTFNGKIVKVRPKKDLKSSILCTTSKDLFKDEKSKKFENLRKKVRHCEYGGDCYSYGLLALGFVDIITESGLKVHDFCPLAPIIIGAGGYFTDWRGKPIDVNSNGDVVAASSKQVLEQALKVLK